jgi:CubicO group peptidase (beta-lactamase class C family)
MMEIARMWMLRVSMATCLALILAPAGKTDEKPKQEPAKVLGLLVKALNGEPVKELHAQATAEFQKELSEVQLGMVLRQMRTKYGKIPENLPEPKLEGARRIFKVQGEKKPFLLTVTIDKEGKLAGLRFQPAFMADLPTKPITLAELQHRLTQVVEQTLAEAPLPSLSLALVKEDRIVWAQAFGYQNLGKKVPADPDTLYVTGSIFKVIVASALMQQVDDGKLELDKPINGYLAKLKIDNPFEKEVPLTLRHLLSHHGGVPNGAQMVPLWRRELPMPLEEFVRKRVKVTSRPGEKFAYSNYAFAFNGYLLGQMDESSFEKAINQRLFEPLGMTHTVAEPTPALLEDIALPYQTASSGKTLSPGPRFRLDVYPAGDMYSTPSDIARFLIMHLNEGKYQGKQVLSKKSVAEMARAQFETKENKSPVGLGWMVSGGKNRRLWHNGAVPGFYTFMGIEPERKVGLVLFCNKYDVLAASLGTFQDPLADVAALAFPLLEKLEMTSRPAESGGPTKGD